MVAPVGRRVLERMGHSVQVARTGLEALLALEQEAFDLVLMDVQMEEMDGLEATRLVRAREQETGGDQRVRLRKSEPLEGARRTEPIGDRQ